MRRVGVLAALLFLALSSVSWAEVNPSSGLIRILCIGESYYPETRLPLLLEADPKIRYQPIPANWHEGTFAAVGEGREDALKFIRQYMPRTYERLVNTYGVIVLSDFEVDVITGQQFTWMEKAVRVDGVGMGKYEMNWDPGNFRTFDRFVSSAVYPVFPADLSSGKFVPEPLEGIEPVPLNLSGRPPNRPHPMLDLPGMRNYKLLGSGDYGYEIPRPGATVIAKFIPKGEDAMIIRPYGKGRSLACLPGLDKIDATSVSQWPYVVDFWINQMWYLADVPIPQDVELVHSFREMALNYINQRSLVTSLIEFVETFGARTQKLYEELGGVDDLKFEADKLYLGERYHESLSKLEEAFSGLNEVASHSVKMKQSALFWIYMVEWFAVTGTAVLTGVVIWTLMVRRRLYKEVSVTRAG